MFVKLDIKKTFYHRAQTKFANPKQARRNDCVEDSGGREMQAAPKHPQVVIGPVQNNFSGLQGLAQRFQIEISQRIDNEIANRLDSHSGPVDPG